MGNKTLKEKILSYVFDVSTQPVRYKDLLSANALYNEGMHVDPGKLNFRINLSKAYLVYAIICTCIIVPIVLMCHLFLPKLNNHIPIAGVIMITAIVCIGFNYFRSWLRDSITQKLIKKAWPIHFPYFTYEKYSQQVERLYNEIMDKELPRKEWEQYILDGIL